MVMFLYLASVIRTIVMEKIVGSWVLKLRDNKYDVFVLKHAVGQFLRNIKQKFSADIGYSLSEDGKEFAKTYGFLMISGEIEINQLRWA